MKLSPERGGELIAAHLAQNATFDRTPQNVVLRAVDNIRSSYPELMAVLDELDWSTRAAAYCRLNIPESHSRAVTTDIFAAEAWIETALLHLIDSGAIVPVVRTAESEADLEKLRKSVAFHGLFPKTDTEEPPTSASESAPAPTGPTEAELDAAIINDWRTLSTTEVRSRCRDAAYKQRLDRLMAEEKI